MKNASAAVLVFLCLALSVAAAPTTFVVGRFTFAVPEGWKKVLPSSPTRKAQLEVGGGDAKAEVTFFHFGLGGGSVADNVARWFAQFPGSEANRKTETVDVGSVKITFAETVGTFSSGMPGGPTTPLADYALRGAILENRESGDVYVKMTGPKAVVEGAAAAFQKMVKDAAQPAAH